jgi:Mycobacterium membrane protein
VVGVTSFDDGGDERRRSTPPADPWLETAPTAALGEAVTAVNRTPLDPTFVAPAETSDEAPRRGRRGWWWALPALALLACLGGARLLPFGAEKDAPRATGPTAGATTAAPAVRATTGGPTLRPTATAAGAAAGAATGRVPGGELGSGTRPERTASGPQAGPAGPAGADPLQVVYLVTAGGAGDVASIDYTDQNRDIIRRSGVPVPWRTTFRLAGTDRPPLVLDAQRKRGGTGPLTCTISLGGKVLSTTTATGRFASAQCAA